MSCRAKRSIFFGFSKISRSAPSSAKGLPKAKRNDRIVLFLLNRPNSLILPPLRGGPGRGLIRQIQNPGVAAVLGIELFCFFKGFFFGVQSVYKNIIILFGF